MLNYVFWAFKPSIEGFRHCRPVVCVDATHLYTKYKHKLFVAVCMDGNQNILPLAFTLMNEEETTTWGWFLNLLREHVVQDTHETVTIIFYCNKGILQAIHQGYGAFNGARGCHRYCLMHLCSNVMSNYKNQQVKDLCWSPGSAKDEASFQLYMDQIQSVYATAHRYLSTLNAEKWKLSHDNGSLCGIMTTNMVETFNGVLKGARRLPIWAIVEITFTKIASYFIERLGLARQMQSERKFWTYYATNILTKNAYNSGRYIAQMINMDNLSAMVFKPASTLNRMERYAVRLSDRTCGCGKWKLYEIPCSHAIQVCKEVEIRASDYVEWFYQINHYLQTYNYKFRVIWDKQYWSAATFTLVYNPDRKTTATRGRTFTTRIRNGMDRSETRAREQYQNEVGKGSSSSKMHQ